MRSYHDHLKTIKTATAPILRASAIFPAIHGEGVTTELLFMGYWILKRHIEEIKAVVNLRSAKGHMLKQETFTITEAKTYRIPLSKYLEDPQSPFTGSLEVEFFSKTNMVFPFPAVVVNYKGPKFSSVVHTAQRIYNNADDEARNSQTEVPESGFNIYADDDREPFFGLINGNRPTEDGEVKMTFFNADSDTLNHTLAFGRLEPYETRLIYPDQEIDLKGFLKGKAGTAKITFHVNGAFPRLVAGNVQRSLEAHAITHTYYDCTKAMAPSDYWLKEEKQWHAASLMVPLLTRDEAYTTISLYPIYSPSKFCLDIEVYSETGELLESREKVLTVSAPTQEFHQIPLKTLFGSSERPRAARIIARSLDERPIPARIKVAFDLGMTPEQLPCNICTNLQPFNPDWESKPFSFKWAPILADQANAPFWIMNSAPHVQYDKSATISLTFFREADTQTLSREITLPPHGFAVIDPASDKELATFFQNKPGWVTAQTPNSYTTTYYFALHPSGIVGGDHGF